MRWCLHDVSIQYHLHDGTTISALNGVSLTVRQGEKLALVGANGSGKSTLAQCLAGLLQPTHGSIVIEREPANLETMRSDADSMAALVFQAPEDNLIAETVAGEIMMTLEHAGADVQDNGQAETILTQFGLDHLADRPVQRLSGGEKQKLAIACALASGRELIVLDEPTSHLDPPGRRELLSLIHGLSDSRGAILGGNPAIILITQYGEDARRFPRVVALDQGKIIFDGPPEDWPSPVPRTSVMIAKPAPTRPDAPVIVAASRLSQVARSAWALPPNPLIKINAVVRAGDAIALCGPIGSGKSTLAYHLAGLVDEYTGTLERTRKDNPQSSPAVMIQFPERQLFCPTVSEDVAFGPVARGHTKARAAELAASVLEALGLNASEFSARSPFDLSAGQQRRVGMAGVAACAAPFYLLDEPTAALDIDGVSRLEKLLADWHESQTAYLIISHDLEWLASVTCRVWIMNEGRLIFDGSWSDSAQVGPALDSIGFPRV